MLLELEPISYRFVNLTLITRLILIRRTSRFRMTAYEFSVQNAMNYINAFAVVGTDDVMDIDMHMLVYNGIHTISARNVWPFLLNMVVSA